MSADTTTPAGAPPPSPPKRRYRGVWLSVSALALAIAPGPGLIGVVLFPQLFDYAVWASFLVPLTGLVVGILALCIERRGRPLGIVAVILCCPLLLTWAQLLGTMMLAGLSSI